MNTHSSRRQLVFLLLASALTAAIASSALTASSAQAAERPNIILIYADDIGYGDLGCYGATKVKTPNLDRLAKEGLLFTDGHCSAGTCTPSRYSLLTGQYAFRKPGTNILRGDANLIIDPARPTLPSMLQKAGYKTAVVGKWHLGLGDKKINWNEEIKPGPREIGFDYSFLIPATGDRTPCVYVENQRVVGLDPADPITVDYEQPLTEEPTGKEHPELLRMKLTHGHDMTIINGISRIGWMSGGKKARWVDENMADDITTKAVKFIDDHAKESFFLYFATHDVHVPRVPHERFKGTSGCGTRGDVIQELDWCVGEVLQKLEELRISDNTLVIFSSDNGPVLDDGYADGAVADLNGHKPAGPLKGGKYSNFEGGTRVPFIARWPAKIKPGQSAALVCQVDLLASFAALTGQELAADAAPDSFNVLSALVGESDQGRETLLEQAQQISLRQGTWKFIPGGAGGGKKKQDGPTPAGQLFDLSKDLGEEHNLVTEKPERAAAMAKLLAELKEAKKTRP